MKIFSFLLLCCFIQSFSLALEMGQIPSALMIGDSHSEGTYGGTLFSLLETKSNFLVDAYAVGGSTPQHWNKGLQGDWGYWERHTNQPEIRRSKPMTPKLQDLLKQKNYQLVVIEQGTNYIWQSDENFSSEIIQTLKYIEASNVKSCYWVGPPSLGKNIQAVSAEKSLAFQSKILRIRDVIKKAVQASKCHWIESMDFTKYPATGGDGIHFDAAGPEGTNMAKKWAEEVQKKITAD